MARARGVRANALTCEGRRGDASDGVPGRVDGRDTGRKAAGGLTKSRTGRRRKDSWGGVGGSESELRFSRLNLGRWGWTTSRGLQ